MAKYIVKEPKEGEAPVEVIKTEFEATISIPATCEKMKYLYNVLREQRAQVALEDAKITNVTANHPEIVALPPVKLGAASIFLEAMGMKERFTDALTHNEAELAKALEEIAEIKNQTGLVFDVTEETLCPTVAKEAVEAPVEPSQAEEKPAEPMEQPVEAPEAETKAEAVQ